MSKEFDDIRTKVRSNADPQESLRQTLGEIASKFRDAADDPARVRELADELDSNRDRFVSDVNSDGSGKEVDVSDAARAMQGPTTPKNAASKAAKGQHTA